MVFLRMYSIHNSWSRPLKSIFGRCLKNFHPELTELYLHYIEDIGSILSNDEIQFFEKDFSEIDYLQTKLYIDYLTINHNSKINKIIQQLRSNTSFVDGPKTFLINLKLDYRISRSIIKECGILRSMKKIVHTNKIGKKIMDGIYEFQIYEVSTIYSTGAKSDLIFFNNGESSYRDISAKIDSWNLEKFQLAHQIKQIFKPGICSFEDPKSEYLYQLTYLLFHCEVERNRSALLTNVLFIELLADDDNYVIKDLYLRLPMALAKDSAHKKPGAVSSSRALINYLGGRNDETFSYLTKKQIYDFRDEKNRNITSLVARNTSMLIDWLILKELINRDAKIAYSKKEILLCNWYDEFQILAKGIDAQKQMIW